MSFLVFSTLLWAGICAVRGSASSVVQGSVVWEFDYMCVQGPYKDDLRPFRYDCRQYYDCHDGYSLTKRLCGPDYVFSKRAGGCVIKGSSEDGCDIQTPSVCPNDIDVVMHSDICSLYYNCSARAQLLWWPDHLQECPFPLLFNADAGTCDHYNNVDCGDREEPTAICDYYVFRCEDKFCAHCNVPDCKGLDDGAHPHPGYPNSNIYITCLDQRITSTDTCDEGMTFDPAQRACVNVQ
ncbi:uncharacterized protein LOC124262601 [Haliotis rubra]|uniref:uncharacterized protein LOC124262601 n=1 Tax=Haliotis rubra TaxID=36100 RepID=UPI001EE59B59|nr:uncharacterized protein LOC124262601 [Haliotis rubra]XP_046553062.1 uncharacterized protein LOC124262601 [Haliotis rubra]